MFDRPQIGNLVSKNIQVNSCISQNDFPISQYVNISLINAKKKKKFPLQFSSVAQLWPTLCDPMNHSTPGFPVHHHLLEFAQTHVHRVSDAIQPSILCHPLLLPPSIFPSISICYSESVLHIRWPKYHLQLQHQSFQWIFRIDFL